MERDGSGGTAFRPAHTQADRGNANSSLRRINDASPPEVNKIQSSLCLELEGLPDSSSSKARFHGGDEISGWPPSSIAYTPLANKGLSIVPADGKLVDHS